MSCFAQPFSAFSLICLLVLSPIGSVSQPLFWPPAVYKTGCITTHSRSCTSGQGRETHANAPKTCIHALVQTHLTENTRAWEFVDFTRMLQQDIKTLEDHIWYETWIANEPIRAQHRICAHYICCSSSSSVCSAVQLVWQILLCENLRYREIISCGSGAADCVRNQFEISHLYVRMNSANRDRDEDTETCSSKHVDGEERKYKLWVICAAFSEEFQGFKHLLSSQPRSPQATRSGFGHCPKHKHTHINTPQLLNHSPYLLKGHSRSAQRERRGSFRGLKTFTFS